MPLNRDQPHKPDHAVQGSRGALVSMVAVAQLVESRIVIPVVVGSSPISHPTFLLALQQLTVAVLS